MVGPASCDLPVFAETDGHAVAWLRSGAGWITVDRGPSPDLHHTLCGGP